ncbi:multiple sugar transport system ATP-binding protein [Variovorax sp. TBS-050B]|uniref:ABC transporter ATP-binding protein n=1 Tax=Variovorax sp. TBS-050B TaxID=2940551 RepID=UPI0024735C7F|nr:sn-glycerol-3-phosphate ABC transporter ATP-binding protein UgpC [Variovorax sp. TBS-050B]MDH6592992.1 multiple sugar transport system ATP-binding protein [Variovorax sp. TBS-050B]
MAYLELQNIQKSFGDVHIIKGVDLEIRKGEFIVFVGPSGCGKSTLLRLIAGLEPISSGKLLLDGKDITFAPSGKRDLAMVFQSYALYPHMSVYDNMSFALKLAGVSRAEIKTKVEHAAKTLNLTQYLDRLPKDLSGGQRQRVAIGRAIVRAPKVFLFDEPLSNLDAALRGNTRVEIHKLHRALGATTIYVTHDQVEAMTLADRVVVLKDGLIEQVGTPLELYDRPANRFVAQFIGMPSMNMVAADAIPSFSAATGGRLPGDGFLGVRPEGLRVHAKQAAAAGVPGRVELIEALGADTLIHVDVAGVPLIARQNERTPLHAGDEVAVELEPSVLHLFNREGRAIRA